MSIIKPYKAAICLESLAGEQGVCISDLVDALVGVCFDEEEAEQIKSYRADEDLNRSSEQPDVKRGITPELWMIWDVKDGDEIVIAASDYVEFCKTTKRDFWGFDVTKVEIGKPRSECEDIETYELNLQVERELKE